MNYCIRDYKSEDYNEINELWEEIKLGGACRGDNQEIIEYSIRLGGKLIVVELPSKEIIGSAWLTFDGRRLYLHHVGVKVKYQNKGFGKLLTKEALKYAKEKSCQIKLEVHQSNKKAISIYKNLGFSSLGDYDIYIVRDINTMNFRK